MKILIGSRALDYWLPNRNIVKETSDWDIISDEPIDGAEFHPRSFLNNSKFDHFALFPQDFGFGVKIHVMSLTGLAIIKRSHLWRTIGFSKHITHFHKHLATRLQEGELLDERISLTMREFPQRGPNLRSSKKDFFDDAVPKKYDHDYLHSLFANEELPMYTRLQKSDHDVMCHKDLWNNLTFKQKCQCVQEEVNVLATERFLVPNEYDFPTKLAYVKALEKVCTTVCSGYFRDFAIDNYPHIIDLYDGKKFIDVKTILEKKDEFTKTEG